MAVADSGIPSPRACLLRSRLALAAASSAADAVMCLYVACAWLAFAAAAATEIGRVACGAGPCCRAVSAASKVKDAAFLSILVVSPLATLLLTIRTVTSPRGKAEKVSAPEAETETESIAEVLAGAMREVWRNTLMRGVLVAGALIELKLFVDLGGSLVEGSHWERICSVVSLVGALGTDVIYCFVVIPYVAQRWMKKQPLI